MVGNEPTNAAEWVELMTRPRTQRRYFSDSEAEEISGVSIGDLRRLQASGAIEAVKAPRVSGGSFRVWSGRDLSIASIAGAMRKYLKFEIRDCGVVLSAIEEELINRIQADSVFSLGSWGEGAKSCDAEHVLVPVEGQGEENDYFFAKSDRDWHINVYDNVAITISGGAPRFEQIIRIISRNMDVIDERVSSASDRLRFFIDEAIFSSSLNISMTIRRTYLLCRE